MSHEYNQVSPRAPTLADLDALPPGVVGEIIEGVLYTMTKPRARHQRTGLEIGSGLLGPFDHAGKQSLSRAQGDGAAPAR